MTGKQPVDHILRPRLPWRDAADGPMTECGLDATKVPVLTREAYVARLKEMGRQRCSLFTCMTCADTASRWGTWDDDPRQALAREIQWESGFGYRRSDRGERLKDELIAIAELVTLHWGEFNDRLTEIAKRREWNAQLDERKRQQQRRTPERKL